MPDPTATSASRSPAELVRRVRAEIEAARAYSGCGLGSLLIRCDDALALCDLAESLEREVSNRAEEVRHLLLSTGHLHGRVREAEARVAALKRWAGAWKDSAKSHRCQERAWNASEWDMLKRVQQEQARVAALEQIASERATRLSNQDDANQTLRERVAALEGCLEWARGWFDRYRDWQVIPEWKAWWEDRAKPLLDAATREVPTPGGEES